MAQYIDSNGFEPLPVYLEEALAELTAVSYMPAVTPKNKPIIDELEARGYIAGATLYMDGTGIAEIAPKGRHYFDEKAAWEARVAAWQAGEEAKDKGDKRHDWATSIVGVVVGAVLTLGTQVLLGILRFG